MKGGVPFWGPNVWHHPKLGMAFFVVVSVAYAALWVRLAVDDGEWPFVLLGVGGLVLTWCLVFRPRAVLLADEVVVVRWFTTRRYPLVEVVDATPGYHGTAFRLADGRTFNAGTLQRPNYAAWFRRRSRADVVATRILAAAAGRRGEPAPEPIEPRRKGDLRSGIFAGIGVMIAAIFGGGGT
jgi:hypothetical protein